MCLARNAQITQNNKFAISLQYLKKEMSNEIEFLHTDKHESLLQIDAMILMGMVKHSQSSQNSILETKDSVQKIQKRALFYYKKVKKALLICPPPTFIASL